MGKKSSPPPQPDPNIGLAAQANMRLAESQTQIANQQLELQRQQMEDARAQYADQQRRIAEADEVFKASQAKQNEMTDLAMRQARKAEEDYDTTYRPIEQRLAADAAAAGGVEAQSAAAGQAGADVQRQIDMQREAAGRQMAQMGVNPNSGRFEALSRTDAIRGAAARGGAMTGARVTEEMRGQQLRSAVAGFGRGIAGTALGGAGQASGMTGITNQTATGSFGLNAGNNAAMQGAYGQGMGGLGQAGNTMGNAGSTYSNAAGILQKQHESAMAAFNAAKARRAAAAAGIGKLVGAGVGFVATGGNPLGAMAGAKAMGG